MSQEPLYWHKLEKFIGRDEVKERLIAMLGDGKSHFVPISGEYGYGKTRLLDEVLSSAREQLNSPALPRGIIDLYHTENHTPEGLAQALVSTFADYAPYFEEYEHQKSERDQAQVAGRIQKVKGASDAMLAACADGLRRLSAERGVLVLLDTAERWVFSSLAGSPSTHRAAPAWKWLREEVCSTLPRGLVVLAGRPEITQLNFAPDAPDPIITLSAFSEDDTKQYIVQTSQQVAAELQTTLITFSNEEIQTLYRLSQGRPILLALFLEKLAHGDERIRHAAATSSPQDFEPLLIKHLGDRQIGFILYLVGRAPKGVNLKLLAEMSSLPENELKKDFETIIRMSFAKTFSGSERLFLHEEMYAMLERNIYVKGGDDTAADRAAQDIYRYYKTNTEQLSEKTGQLYVEYAETNDADQKKRLGTKIDDAAKELQVLNTDFAYYRWLRAAKLAEDPVEMGLRRYYRLAHEAATSNDLDSLVLLRFELIRFIRKMEEKAGKGEPQPWLPFLQGFLFMQAVWEKNAAGQLQAADIKTLMLQDLEQVAGLKGEQKALLNSLLKVWLGISLIYASEADYPGAEQILGECIDALQDILHTPSLTWLRNTALALAYRQRAYLYKRRGHFDDAIVDYRNAAQANRYLDFNFEEATIRNDLGDTQVLTGYLDDAYLNLKDAFDLRQKMKNGARLVLSYSTLARYFTAGGAYAEALENATRGKNLSSMIGRGTAFARIAWAEAARRSASGGSCSLARQEELLETAEKAILEALDGLNEIALTIDAKLELGCIYRERMRLPSSKKRQADFQSSDQLLLEVNKLAKDHNPPIFHIMADAMSNRIWLGLFAQDEAFARQAAKDFEALDIFGFDLTQPGVFGREASKMAESDNKPILQFIGKYHAALGTLYFVKEEKPEQKKMYKIARHWLLALEYSVLFAPEHRGLNAARQTIYKKVKKFNQDELKWLTQSILQAEQAEGITITKSLLQKLMRENSFWIEDK